MNKGFFWVIILGSIFSFHQVYAQRELTILSYNVWDGFRQNKEEGATVKATYLQWLKEINPDIVAYQEMCFFSQDSLENFAAEYAHPYGILSNPFETVMRNHPVALTAKSPIVNVRKVEENMHHAYLYAKIEDIHLVVVHFSPFSDEKRENEVRQVLAEVSSIPKGEKIVIMGDFNAFSRTDSSRYEGKPNYHVLELVENAGFVDAFKLFHEEFKATYPTDVRPFLKERLPVRIDFMMVSEPLASKLIAVDILHDEITSSQISDHYPMIMKIRM